MITMPTVEKFMTASPHTIGIEQTMSKAKDVMREYRIRHLPVLEGGKLVGILSDRDIKLVESFKDVDPDKVLISEALSPEPYITGPQTSLAEVCKEMAAHKYGCTLIVDNTKLVGLFTWIDALQAMTEILEMRSK